MSMQLAEKQQVIQTVFLPQLRVKGPIKRIKKAALAAMSDFTSKLHAQKARSSPRLSKYALRV
jgi:hypothetical protein